MIEENALVEDLRRALAQNDLAVLDDALHHYHPANIAEAMEELDLEQILRILKRLPANTAPETFGRLSLDTQQEVIRSLPPAEAATLLTAMSHDERVDIAQCLSPEESEAILRLVARSVREDILKLASYPEGTCGAIMTSDYAFLFEEQTVEQALLLLRQVAPDSETIYRAYVTDRQRHLVGTLTLKDLFLAAPNKKLSQIMLRDFPAVNANDDQEEAYRLIKKFDMVAVPVVDDSNMLLGIVTFDDAIDVAESEMTEDMHRHASIGPLTTSLKEASVGLMVRKRVPWLLILVLMNVFSGAGIAHFEDVIEATVALVFFLPLLIDSGGNAGSQSATLMIRSMAVGDVRMRDWLGLLRKEFLIAFVMGGLMALAVSTIGYFRAGPEVAVVVSITMVCVVLVGSLIGMSLPFLLRRLNLDPATASAPLVTSIADIAGVLIYFSIASWYLGLSAGG